MLVRIGEQTNTHEAAAPEVWVRKWGHRKRRWSSSRQLWGQYGSVIQSQRNSLIQQSLLWVCAQKTMKAAAFTHRSSVQ